VYEVPPYLDAFNAMRTHLMLSAPLSKNLDTDKKAIYEALANGNSFIGYDMLSDTTGFRFYAGDGTKTVSMGESIAYKKGIHLAAMAPEAKGIDPEQITIKILRNSLVVAKGDGNGLSYDPDRPGPYRAELWLGIGDNARLWALSNPIYVTRANLSK
jgi:hypothetical protein